MARRRNILEIYAKILEIGLKGATKTQVVYGANLNFKRLDQYVNQLSRRGLIKVEQSDGGRVTITTSDVGRKFLTEYRRFREIFERMVKEYTPS